MSIEYERSSFQQIFVATGIIFFALVIGMSQQAMGMVEDSDWENLRPSKEENAKDLIKASKEGNLKRVNELLAIPGIDSNQQDSYSHYPLLEASSSGHIAIVNMLLAKGSLQNIKGPGGMGTPLHAASKRGYIEIVKVLLNNDPTVINARDNMNRTPLFSALENKKIEVAKELLLRDADVNMKDRSDTTPLMVASAKDDTYLDIVTELCVNGAELNAQDRDNKNTALHWAAYQRNVGIVRELLGRGANPDMQNSLGDAPLHIASTYDRIGSKKKQDLELVQALAEKNANPNVKNNVGDTPLHAAARRSHSGIVSELLGYGANPTITNKAGQTPLDVAKSAIDDFYDQNFVAEKRNTIAALSVPTTTVLQKKLGLLNKKLSTLRTSLIRLQTKIRDLKKTF